MVGMPVVITYHTQVKIGSRMVFRTMNGLYNTYVNT